ncbi:hypothetical protein K2P56_04445 [Patescibacteria group bacterium]|nr:hypothetical protein [Patescibacteria group bacterium]
MSQENSEDQGVEVAREVAESLRSRPVMWAGMRPESPLVGYQCVPCKGERVTRRPGIAGAIEEIRCESCNGLGYVSRSE